ncbi:arylsulfatase I-like isoform X1 [Pomacea canaliculata]|uniref:arylsulfatase I-like isoform X1 n=1 Tax=Pomacea canaliculata TaxID=400727 RepID=UPI000D72EADD|nr:arylsulfatase I-like isoform X1 [Pomacea canaliculata]
MFLNPTLWLPMAVLSCYLIASIVSAQQPNIMLILIDDMGYDERSSRDPRYRTPTMDDLASKSVRLNYLYTQPSCTMSRAALLTGRMPHTMGIEHVFDKFDNRSVPVGIKLFPAYLQEANYQTHAIGKWHLGMCNESMIPTRRGFHTFSGCLHGNSDHFFKFRNEPYDFWTNETLDRSVKGKYDTEVLAQRAISIIKAHKKSGTTQPFFIYLAFKAIHSPITVPAYLSDRCSHISDPLIRDRCGTMAGVDDALKNITKTLEGQGYTKKPLMLMVMSDNGGSSPNGASNWPLRGKKATVFEGGTRVPAFMYSNGLLPDSPRDYNGLIHITDVPLTLISMARNSNTPVVLPDVDGKDQWQAIKQNGPSQRDRMVYEMWDDEAGVRKGKYKLVYHTSGPCSGWYNPLPGVNTTLPEDVLDCGGFMLFDLEQDPYEINDLSKDPDYADEMNDVMEYFNMEKARKIPAQISTINPNMPAVDADWKPDWCPGA